MATDRKILYGVFVLNLPKDHDGSNFEGAYEIEDDAVKACLNDNYCIVPFEINKPMPENAWEVEYAWFPTTGQTKDRAIEFAKELREKKLKKGGE